MNLNARPISNLKTIRAQMAEFSAKYKKCYFENPRTKLKRGRVGIINIVVGLFYESSVFLLLPLSRICSKRTEY